MILRCATLGLSAGNRSRHANAVSVTSGTEAASEKVQHEGLRAMEALEEMVRYFVNVPWAALLCQRKHLTPSITPAKTWKVVTHSSLAHPPDFIADFPFPMKAGSYSCDGP